MFLLDTGCRYSEVSTITWDAIDTMEWRTLNIYRSKVGEDGILRLTERLKAVLQRRRAEGLNSPYVFPNRGDSSKPRGHATKGIRAAIERAGCNSEANKRRWGRRRTVHSFRDTFAS